MADSAFFEEAAHKLRSEQIDLDLLEDLGDILRQEEARPHAISCVLPCAEIYCTHTDPKVVNLAGRVLVNISCYNAENVAEIPKETVLPRMVQILTEPEIGDRPEATAGLAQNLSFYSEENKIEMAKAGIPSLLVSKLGFSDLYNSLALTAIEQLLDVDDSSFDIARSGQLKMILPLIRENIQAMSILQTVISAEFCARYVSQDLDLVRELITLLPEFPSLSSTLGFLATDDAAMNLMLEENSLETAVNALKENPTVDNMMWIGNLARSNETCLRVVEMGIMEPLTEMITSRDPRAVHISSGLLRNLSLASESVQNEVADGPIADKLVDLLSHPRIEVVSFVIETMRFVKRLPGAIVPLLERLSDERASRIPVAAARSAVVIASMYPDLGADFLENRGAEALQILLVSPFFQLHSDAANLLETLPQLDELIEGLEIEKITLRNLEPPEKQEIIDRLSSLSVVFSSHFEGFQDTCVHFLGY